MQFTGIIGRQPGRHPADPVLQDVAQWAVKQDLRKAILWMRKAALGGDSKAMFNLALSLAEGEGAKRDPKEARKWFRKAAARGHAGAMYCLGEVYRDGDGVRANPVKALAWFSRAKAAGDPDAAKEI